MSAWAQVAWVVSELNNRFDFNNTVTQYQTAITQTAQYMEEKYNDIMNKTRIIVSLKEPSPQQYSLVEGTLWFGQKEES